MDRLVGSRVARMSGIVTWALLAAAGVAGNRVSAATPDAVPPGYVAVTKILKYTQQDLVDAQHRAALYARIRVAAEQVCESPNSRQAELLSQTRKCERLALE